MRQVINIFFFFVAFSTFGQQVDFTTEWQTHILNEQDLYKKDFIDSLSKLDYGSLWTQADNSPYGFIGDNFQRIKIKIISAKKAPTKPDTYYIIGKSMVKNNICQFSGTIIIEKIRVYKNMHWGVDDEFKKKGIKKQGVLVAKYHFAEDSTQTHSGTFEGILTTLWYIDKNGQIKYDDIEKFSDSYCNNQFIGAWTSYKNISKKVCNWGDYRVPFSGDLDIGAGEFSPDDKYLQYGWQTYRDAYTNNDKNAKAAENENWWK